jgi:ech hydrogenase subunit A
VDSTTTAVGLLLLAPLAGAAVLSLPIWREIGRPVAVVVLLALVATLAGIALALGSSGVVGEAIRIPIAGGPLDPAEPLGAVAWTLGPIAIGLLLVVIGLRARSSLLILLAAVGTVLALLAAAVELSAATGEGEHATVAFLLDPLSALLLVVSAGVGSAIVVYALAYEPEHLRHRGIDETRGPRFIAWLLLFLSAMHLLVLADDLRALAVGWELTTLCSFGLIGFDGDRVATTAARRALAYNLAGGLGLGLAVLLAGPGATLSGVIESAAAADAPTGIAATLVPLVLAGFIAAAATKSALLPAHPWLLGAMVAAAPVSALLHASTMVKAGSYLLLRLSPAMAAEQPIGSAVALLGGLTFAATALLALRERDLKRVLAYSTISTLGLIAAAAGIGSPTALAAGALLLLFHAIAKALAFLSVGAMEQITGSRDIEALVGIGRRRPQLAGLLALAAGALVLPPFVIVVAKWALLVAGSGDLALVTLLALGGAAGLVLWTAVTARLIVRRTDGGPEIRGRTPATMMAPMLVLAAGTAAGILLAAPVARAFADPIATTAFGQDAGLAAGWSIVLAGAGFTVPYIATLVVVAIAAAAIVAIRIPRTAPQPYLAGANVGAGAAPQFHGVRGAPVAARGGGFYWGALPAEGRAQRLAQAVTWAGWAAQVLVVAVAVALALAVAVTSSSGAGGVP